MKTPVARKRRPDPADDPVVSSEFFSMAPTLAGHDPKGMALIGWTEEDARAYRERRGMAEEAGPARPSATRSAAKPGGRRMRGLHRVSDGHWECAVGGDPWTLSSEGGRWVARGAGQTREASSFKEIVGLLRGM